MKEFKFVFDSGFTISVVAKYRGEAINLLCDSLSIPRDFVKSHAKITYLGVFS